MKNLTLIKTTKHEIPVILQSRLFRGDPKLEAAAVSDPAHILPGATGDHVRRIQLALIRLEGAIIAPDGFMGRRLPLQCLPTNKNGT